ncbi:MAG: HlyD family efflux transporter periplasmic adaptor subunit [Scytonema sp. PMC 1069.18]|nr:HlyD family efflux transporter periplasmic adaptor subunit [Scytonema sp. PMC 1069.18]MEC4885831.1 HlyD family efflux transporter periplasmic adaptor subunit [Scytonema sp. PMC 1070.18]
MTIQYNFDQPVLLQQSPTWSRIIAWGIVGVTAFTIIWASVFKIDESIPVSGKLEPKAPVTDIQAPIGGVVKLIHVYEGQEVKKGEALISLEQTTSEAKLESLKKTRLARLQEKLALEQENEFYRRQLKGSTSPQLVAQQTAQLSISPELTSLTKSRVAIASENQLYRAQLIGSTAGVTFTKEQQLRLQTRQLELLSRLQVAELEIKQTQEQLRQTQLLLASAKKTLVINQDILNRLESVAREGAIAQIQVLKQQQDVESKQSEINRLTKEEQRFKLAIAQAQQKLRNTAALSQEELLARITANDKSIAEIDSQLTKVIIDNQKRIYEINSQISQIDSELSKAKETLKYQKISSPVDGIVFELKAKTPGFVANSSEPILKIVPKDNLIAKVSITNRDIGFVRVGQTVDVRIDSFPFQQYGDIKGELVWIGSDALPPDEVQSYYRFPAKVRLDKQALLMSDRQLPLQSGMSINANIKLRQRTIISIFTDFLVQKADTLKSIR